VPVDEHGLMVEEGKRLSPYAKFAMVTPSHQSPLGVTLSLERRMALLEWASKAGSWIVEDDYDSEFRYQGRPLPALKSLDRNDLIRPSGRPCPNIASKVSTEAAGIGVKAGRRPGQISARHLREQAQRTGRRSGLVDEPLDEQVDTPARRFRDCMVGSAAIAQHCERCNEAATFQLG